MKVAEMVKTTSIDTFSQYDRVNHNMNSIPTLQQAEETFRIKHFEETLKQCKGDIVEAARILKISISTAYRIHRKAKT